MQTQTTKKVKVQGQQKYVNQATGEVEDFQVISMEDRDFNFHKLWLGHIIMSLDLIGNEKIKVLTYLLESANRDNIILGTQRGIAQAVGVSVPTVNATLKALTESNLLKKNQSGVYILNPDVIFKGTHLSRLNVLLQYTTPNPDPEATQKKKPSTRKKKTEKTPSCESSLAFCYVGIQTWGLVWVVGSSSFFSASSKSARR